jgi:hypothetical protein
MCLQILVLEIFNFIITTSKHGDLTSSTLKTWICDIYLFLQGHCKAWSPHPDKKVLTVCSTLDLLITCAYRFPEHQLACMDAVQEAFSVQPAGKTGIIKSLFSSSKVT